MLKAIELTYFQRHADLRVVFEQGLSAVRAPNEGGKSTIIRAILYALYGARSLPAALSEIVTWGHKENELKVVLDIEANGRTFTFTRSKAGAEVTVEGKVHVTGQTEVTNFAAELIGADLNAANRLMVANQGNMRGALESGPKAAAEMVESLADFELFDNLLNRAGEQLPLGSDAHVKQRLEYAESTLEELRQRELPCTKAHEDLLATHPQKIADKQVEISEVLQPAYDKARQDLDRAKNNRSTYDLLTNNRKKVENMLADAQAQLISAKQKAKPVDTTPIKTLQAQLEGASTLAQQRSVYAKLQRLNATYPEVFWEGTAEELNAELDAVDKEYSVHLNAIQTASAKGAELSREIDSLTNQRDRVRSKIQKDDHCSACGQLLQNHEEIRKRNEELEKEIEALDAQVEPLRKQLEESNAAGEAAAAKRDEVKETYEALKAVVVSARPFEDFIREYAPFLNVNLQAVPVQLSWKGPVPSDDTLDTAQIQQQIADIEQAADAARTAQARVETLTSAIEGYTEQVQEMTQQIEGYELENLQHFHTLENEAGQRLAVAQALVREMENELQAARFEIQRAKDMAAQHAEEVERAKLQVEACKIEISELAFNNALVKRIRELRPVVGNQLWNMVLASVSSMFSQMRGVQSVVMREKDGFKVNGQDIDTLSGSTLDLLGLAIRIALIKTFLPYCPFIILDEPFSAADIDRTQDALAFIQSVDIPQVILITHEDVTEQIADNLITL